MHAITLPIPNLTGYGDADRDLAAEARLGGRYITKSLNSESHYIGGVAIRLREVLADPDLDNETIASEVKRIWIQMIEPPMGLQRYARLQARGWDDKPGWLRESALDWPIYRAAAAARDRLFRMVAGAPEQEA